jgi:predicted DNA-binding transcriptional regulator AlpA
MITLGRTLMSSMRTDLLNGPWYSTDELAALIGVDASSIRRWRTSNPPQGPPFIRLSSRVTIYSASDVETWLRTKRIDPERAA